MDLFKELQKNSPKKLKTIIFPESHDERILEAVEIILKKKISKVILIDANNNIEKLIKTHENLTIRNVDFNFNKYFLNEYISLKKKPEIQNDRRQSEAALKDPLTFSCMLLRNKSADGIIAGSVYSTSEVLRNGISIIGLSRNHKTVSSFFLITFPRHH